MNSKSWVVSYTQLIDEYERFWNYVLRSHPDAIVKSSPLRAIDGIISGHLLAALNREVSDLFVIKTDPVETVVDVLLGFIDCHITHREFNELTRRFEDTVDREVNEFIATIRKHADPVYSIWEVFSITTNHLMITYNGDYRIEQWHNEHNVRRNGFGEYSSVDLDCHSLFDMIRHVYIPYTKHEAGYEDNILQAVDLGIRAFLFNDHIAFQDFEECMRVRLSLTDIERAQLLHDFELLVRSEYLHQLSFKARLRDMDSYTLNNHTLTVHFINSLKPMDAATVARLEVINSINNGDYVPENSRRQAGM